MHLAALLAAVSAGILPAAAQLPSGRLRALQLDDDGSLSLSLSLTASKSDFLTADTMHVGAKSSKAGGAPGGKSGKGSKATNGVCTGLETCEAKYGVDDEGGCCLSPVTCVICEAGGAIPAECLDQAACFEEYGLFDESTCCIDGLACLACDQLPEPLPGIPDPDSKCATKSSCETAFAENVGDCCEANADPVPEEVVLKTNCLLCVAAEAAASIEEGPAAIAPSGESTWLSWP